VSRRSGAFDASQGDSGSSTPIERRQAALGIRLRSLRLAVGLDQKALAARLGITHSMVSKYEGDRKTPTAAMLDRIATALDLDQGVRTELADRVGELAVEITSLRLRGRRGYRSIQRTVGEQEATATTIWSYHSSVMPGLLQIPEYTAAMLAVMAPEADATTIVAGRRKRQQILYDEGKSLRFLMTEPVMLTRVAPVPVLRPQIRRLLALVEGFDHIEIEVIPIRASLQAWTLTGFDITGDVVEVELLTSQVLIRDPREVAEYVRRFEGLWASAVRGAEVVPLLRATDRELAEGQPRPGGRRAPGARDRSPLHARDAERRQD
jgi:transcriptional regulator with XRE-family HTH domain